MRRALLLAVHDVEPRTFQRVREIRAWLLARGVDRATLLVIPAADRHPIGASGQDLAAWLRAPAADRHPIGARDPDLTAWLRARIAGGDTVAQHGLAHRAARPARWPRRILAGWQGGGAAEFPGLGPADTATRVHAGRRLLAEVELEPRGFVAPGYAYTGALRAVLAQAFDWFADVGAIHGPAGVLVRAPALCLGTSTRTKRALSPPIVRAGARCCGPVMRLDVHPADFDHPGHVRVLERVLERAAGREVLTYDELLG